mmetsp:Transcript_137695/g.357703  ORF Transcript_137695/g.357703 Transcript_137695/m.357703 type:complete len:346 (+) Transcript_137695:88-1125(+)
MPIGLGRMLCGRRPAVMARRKLASACRVVLALAAARWMLRGAAQAFLPPASGATPFARAPGAAVEASVEGLLPSFAALALGGAAAVQPAAAAASAAPVVAATADAAAIAPTDAIVQAFLLTFVSEIGDKTFFIAAILAAGGASGGQAGGQEGQGGNQKVLTFGGAIAALAVMTGLAVGIGQLFHSVPDAGGLPVDDICSILAFGFFGVKLLTDAWNMEDDGSLLDEKEEAEEAIRESAPAWMSGGGAASLIFPPLVLQAFVLVFAAEIGDRSFISAAALSAQGGPEGAAAVFIGGITAHGIATLMAVLLGEVISKYVSEKQLAYIGGVLFLIFAATSGVKLAGLL